MATSFHSPRQCIKSPQTNLDHLWIYKKVSLLMPERIQEFDNDFLEKDKNLIVF